MKKHIVKQGECLSIIASKYQISTWQDIYNHEANTRLREVRPNPDCLYPGDVVYIPDTEPEVYKFSTNQKHTIQLTVPKRKVVLQFQNALGENMTSMKYEIHVNGQTIKGETSGGKLEEEIPVSTGNTRLKLWPDPSNPELCVDYELGIGNLDPTDEVSGLQGRLKNLGYYGRKLDNDFGEQTSWALVEFQIDHGITPTGNLNSETMGKLKELYND